MPVWMEIVINVIGYAGFIAVATYHRSQMKISRSEKFPDHRAPNCRAFSLPYAVRPQCGPACRP